MHFQLLRRVFNSIKRVLKSDEPEKVILTEQSRILDVDLGCLIKIFFQHEKRY